MTDIIVIGGGLAGLSAAHTALEAGHSVCLIDKKAFMGGNSTKATSGINGAGTNTQKSHGIPDSAAVFEEDTVRSGTGVKKGPCPPSWPLAKALADGSADGVHWIQKNFGLALDQVSRLGGHSWPRTHRSGSGGKFPGMEITYALIKAYENIAKTSPDKAQYINKARVNKLLSDSSGKLSGVQYVTRDGKTKTFSAPVVVIATGGFGAGVLDKKSLLNRVRPDLMHLPTTNGDHCTGDGIDIAVDFGAEAIGLTDVQVHPTGLVNPKYPEARTRFLAAGALRGEGGILLDRNGKRFCNDLGTRDYVTGKMWENQGPFRLVLNSKAASGIAWHCKHYTGRGVMKQFSSAADLAKEMKIPVQNIADTFEAYNGYAKNGNDPWGKPAAHCKSTPFFVEDKFFVAVVDPIVHYTMGGIKIDETAAVVGKDGNVIPGLFAAGEAAGGVHGRNRLGGSALGECVVIGRLAGQSVIKFLASSSSSGSGKKEYTAEEVAKHNTKGDCWVVVNGEVLDVTTFLADHPGGEMAIMTFAGRDATEEFNMLHDADVVEKYAPECIIGTLKPGSKL